MSDANLPDPLVPAIVDLRDFGFMPLHVQRLRDSELVDLSTGDEFKAAVLLWAFSWHQQPAGSLPNDDRILAARSGARDSWRKVKEMALRGFVQCSDGRLYHPIIAQAALDAWDRREQFQERQDSRETRQQRWRAELSRLSELLRRRGVETPQRPTKGQLLELCKRHGVDVSVDARETQRDASRDANVDACVDACETQRDAGEIAKTGTETGTETEGGPALRSPPAPAPAHEPARATHAREAGPPPEAEGFKPTAAGAVCKAMRQAGLQQANPGDPRLLALLAQGATVEEFAGIAAEAAGHQPPKGFAWVLTVLQSRRAEAAAIALAPPVAPAPKPGELSGRQPVYVPPPPLSDAERAAADAKRREVMAKHRRGATSP